MAAPALRFLHASDLHLERPPSGLTEAPDFLRSQLVDAPFLAAQRVLALALEERVDFVALAGDICDPLAAGPRGVAMLSDAFDQLNEQRTAVYWASGPVEAAAGWPAGCPRHVPATRPCNLPVAASHKASARHDGTP